MELTIQATRTSKPNDPVRRQKPTNYLDMILQENYAHQDQLSIPPTAGHRKPESFDEFADIDAVFL